MKKHNKFSVVIPVVSVLTMGSILPITSYAAETNKLPHLTNSMHAKTGIDTKIHAPKHSGIKAKTDTNTTTDTKAKTDTSATSDTKEKTDTNTTTIPDASANADTKVIPNTIPDTKTNTTTDTEAKTDTSASTDNNAKIMRNGKMLRLNSTENTADYYPQPDKDPYVVPAQTVKTQTKYKDAQESDFIKLADATLNGKVVGGIGIQNNKTVTYGDVPGKIVGSLPPNVIEGTQFKEETIWELRHNQLEPKSLPHIWSVAEMHGIAETNYQEFGFSLGLDWSPIKDVLKISGEASAKFGSSTTITDQNTETKTDQFPAKPATYPYNDYRVAVYQKTVRYSIIPGQKLKDAFKDLYLSDEINVTVYKADELRPIVTPDNPK